MAGKVFFSFTSQVRQSGALGGIRTYRYEGLESN